MLRFELPLTPKSDLQQTFGKRYFELKGLEKRVDKSKLAADISLSQLVQPIIGNINRGAFSECEPIAYNRFLGVASGMLRTIIGGLLDSTSPDLSCCQTVQDCCDWLCSLATVGPADLATKIVLGSVWTQSRLSALDEISNDLSSYVSHIVSALTPLQIPSESLNELARVEIILHIGNKVASGKDINQSIVATAKEWCQDFVLRKSLSESIRLAAKGLGIDVPEDPIEPESPKHPGPSIFRAPQIIVDENLQAEFEQCLLELLGVPITDLLNRQTSGSIERLEPDSNIGQAVATFYHATTGLWDAFWMRGDRQALNVARTLARFVYSYHKTHDTTLQFRISALNLFTITQLADLIRISGLQAIKSDAILLYRAENCQFNPLLLLIGIVQVHAGECRALKSEDDNEGCDELLMLNGEQLRQIHKEYERVARERRPDETEAWMFIEPEIDRVLGVDSINRPSVDKTFVDLVNRGNLRDVYDYTNDQLDKVRSNLEQKLVAYRLSGDHLMEPIGRIFQPHAPKRNTLLPAFENAKRLLAEGQYVRAATEFEDIAERKGTPGFQQQVSRDYQAYALAKQGIFIQARPLLRALIQGNYRFSSAFWNLACIEGERANQIDALTQGMQRAPHMRMLHAIIYLHVILNQNEDEQACRWLSLLPFMEAQVLQYHHEYYRLGDDDSGRLKRENILKRISAYLNHGDPETLDPTRSRPRLIDINHFLDSLKQRDHPEVIGFWFKCHEPFEGNYKEGRDRKDYYSTKTDILSDIGLEREAAVAFEDELDCHIAFLEYIADRIPPAIIHEVRKRVETRLRSCMTPDLESIGKKLYRRVQEYDANNKFGTKILLYSEPQRKIHEFYAGGAAEPLERILIRVSQDARNKLHSLADYPGQRPALKTLVEGLQKHEKVGSAEALHVLLEHWEQFQQQNAVEERAAIMTKAHNAFASLQAALQRDLSPVELEMGNGIVLALGRVNGKLAQDGQEQPKIRVSELSEVPPSFAGNGDQTAFALRISSTNMQHSAKVRLLDATARMRGGERTFLLRDNLSDFAITLSPDQSAVLTFEEQGDVAIGEPCVLELQITYELSEQKFTTGAINITVHPRPYQLEPIRSPYIFNRGIEPSEIPGHFFGRVKEETRIFDLISGSGNIGYIEGIRRTGKTSLFSSICCRIASGNLPVTAAGTNFIPVRLAGGSVNSFLQVGQIVQYFFSEITRNATVASAGVTAPSEEACCSNLMVAYRSFEDELSIKLPNHSILAFWDDFQGIVDLAAEVGSQYPHLSLGIRSFLEIIRDRRHANSKLIWLLAGYRSWMRFRDQLGGVNLWAELEAIQIDFLDENAVKDIVVSPLHGAEIYVPQETIARMYQLTCGHPEVVQKMADTMLKKAKEEQRPILTPADADQSMSVFDFGDSWCSLGELSASQKRLIGTFLSAVPPFGGQIEPHRLVPPQKFTDEVRNDVTELVARKIMTRLNNGTVAIKAPVLELWLRRHWKNEAPPSVAAIFLDLANLTQGTGADEIMIDGVPFGDVVAGRFKLKTVLDRIDDYASSLTPAPIAEKWAINYPKGSKASGVANLNDYQLENIPEDIMQKGRIQKGTDDTMLLNKLSEVMSDRPAISHVVLVTGDKDFRVAGVENQLRKGKTVHVITTKTAGASSYSALARTYPERCKVVFLEDLLSADRSR
jgi:uncharacterized LabA/DUF88 family protein